MQLGIFTKDLKSGVLKGSIRTLGSVVDDVEIVPVAKRSEGSPDYRVYGPTGSDFGAGWNKTARDSKKPYISLVLRDPAFNNGQELYPILTEGENGQFMMIWQAPDPNRAPTRPAMTPAGIAAEAPAPGKRGK
jgi:uncharacterized protein (DUF736 family)